MGLGPRADGGRRAQKGESEAARLHNHLVGNAVQCPEPQEPEPITSLCNGVSLSGLPPPPRPCRLRDGGGMALKCRIAPGWRRSFLGLPLGALSLREALLGSAFGFWKPLGPADPSGKPRGRGARSPQVGPELREEAPGRSSRGFPVARWELAGLYVTPALRGGPCDTLSHGNASGRAPAVPAHVAVR